MSIQKLEEARHKAIDMKQTGGGQASPSLSLREADQDRDNSADSLRTHLKAGLKRNNQAYRDACKRLYKIFERNNLGLSALPYEEESVALRKLFEDFDNHEAKQDLVTVHATEWLQELKSDQRRFEQIIQSHGNSSAAHLSAEAQSLRVLVPALKNLFKVLDVAEEGKLTPNISDSIRHLNVLIEDTVRSHSLR